MSEGTPPLSPSETLQAHLKEIRILGGHGREALCKLAIGILAEAGSMERQHLEDEVALQSEIMQGHPGVRRSVAILLDKGIFVFDENQAYRLRIALPFRELLEPEAG